jgi:hypothetical protein
MKVVLKSLLSVVELQQNSRQYCSVPYMMSSSILSSHTPYVVIFQCAKILGISWKEEIPTLDFTCNSIVDMEIPACTHCHIMGKTLQRWEHRHCHSAV